MRVGVKKVDSVRGEISTNMFCKSSQACLALDIFIKVLHNLFIHTPHAIILKRKLYC